MQDIHEYTNSTANIVKMSPPWYIYANKIKNTYGVSDFVQVNDLIETPSGNYYLVINAFNDDVAYALRQILPLNVKIGNITVNLIIFNTKGENVKLIKKKYTIDEVNKLFNIALKGNPLFIKNILTEGILSPFENKLIGDVVIVIDKKVVQFYNDDISELCNNFNEVASKVFDEITRKEFDVDAGSNIKIGFSTYDPNCKNQK